MEQSWQLAGALALERGKGRVVERKKFAIGFAGGVSGGGDGDPGRELLVPQRVRMVGMDCDFEAPYVCKLSVAWKSARTWRSFCRVCM